MINKTWNRKKIIDFCNAEIFPKIHYTQWIGIRGELMEVVKTVSDYRRKHNFPEEMIADVVDGFLYINGDAVGRIAMKKRINNPLRWSDGADYWENRILARQEACYD